MLHTEHLESLNRSRRALIEEIGDTEDLTFIRGVGNLGDELIWAGTRALLEGRAYREIGLDELASSSGHTALLAGGGAWCRTYHEWAPRALALAERCFGRVIVLPSSFDPGEDRVRTALERTRATVYARELESLRRIDGLCRTHLAHDCAFYFDFSSYEQTGEGVLNAFRTDRERTRHKPAPPVNDDISVTCTDLEAWLETIAAHALIRTDRAHVMIAGALMGKEVEYAPSNYHKVDGLAAMLSAFPVRPLGDDATEQAPGEGAPEPDPTLLAIRTRLRNAAPPPPPARGSTEARTTALILTRDRPGTLADSVRSVLDATTPAHVLLVDNNSAPAARDEVAALAATDPRIELYRSERNLGCAGGRRFATERAQTDYVLLLDDDAELVPGALEHLIRDLDEHPEALATTAVVVGADGRVQHFGGAVRTTEQSARFDSDAAGQPLDEARLSPSGPTGWVPGTAVLVRRAAFHSFPIDPGMAAYYEDNEWCHRVETARPGSFRRCREALVLHRSLGVAARVLDSGVQLSARSEAAERLAAHARFLRSRGVVLETDLPELVPELVRPGGAVDIGAARLLLELVAANGTDWLVTEWLRGGLAPLFASAELAHAQADRRALETRLAELERRAASAEARLGDADARLAASEAHGSWADRHIEELDEYVTELGAERSELVAQIAFLDERHITLLRVQAGRWWRLRGRLLAAAALAGRATSARRHRYRDQRNGDS